MKMTLTGDRFDFFSLAPATAPMPRRPVKRSGFLRSVVRGLEWIGSLLEANQPDVRAFSRTPEWSYWRVHGWPF